MAAMLFGSFFMAMPLAIIGNNFEKAWQELAPEMGEKEEEDEHEKAMRSIRPVDPDTFREHTWEYRRIRASILYFSLTRRLSKLHAIATRTFDQMKQRAKGAASPADGGESPPPANDPRMVLHKDIINVTTVTVSEALQCHDAMIEHVRRCFRVPWKNVAHHMDGTTSVQRSHGHSSISGKRFSVTAKQDAMKHMLILRGLHDEAEKVDEMVRARKRGGWRDKLWLLTDVPESSKLAHYIYKFIMVTVFFSVVLFCMQTLPELQSYGESSAACRLIVNKECRKQEALYTKNSDEEKFRILYPACTNQTRAAADTDDKEPYYDGCMEKKVSECMFPYRENLVVKENVETTQACKEDVWSCLCDDPDTEYSPFRDHKKEYPLCKRPQCQLNGGRDLADTMQTAEIIFVALFTARDSAEDFSRLNALLFTATDWIFIPAYCFALP